MKQRTLKHRSLLGTSPSDLLFSEPGAALIVFAILALLPVFFSGYMIYILPQYMLFGVLAMSLGLLWGFAGLVSFGQAGFFALGAYTMGLSMKSGGGMIDPAYLGLLLSLVVGGILAAAVGYFLFSAGVRGTYFVLVTLALSIMLEQIAVSQSQITGGWNGMFIDRMSLNLGPFGKIPLLDDAPIYYVILPAVAIIYVILYTITVTRFGKILNGIRENEDRLISLGFNASLYKTGVFAISGAVACFAGALYGTHANFVAPSLAGVLFSTEVVVWVAIGGRGSLLGVLLGGILVASFSNYLSAITPEYWQLVLGLLFVAVLLYFRGGVAGAVAQLVNARRAK